MSLKAVLEEKVEQVLQSAIRHSSSRSGEPRMYWHDCWVTGLGPYATGGPVGVCTPPVVGLIGVINSAGRIHDGERRGPAVLSTFSGAASTVGLGLSMLTHLRGERRLKFRLLCHTRNLRVQRADLSLIGCLLRHLVLPLGFEQLRLSCGLILQFSQFYFTLMGYAGCLLFQVL